MSDFEPGTPWVFVHRDGRVVEYTMAEQILPLTPDPDGKGPGLDAMYSLLNPATGKYAYVSQKWLREGPVAGGPHWLLAACEMAA
jgi:hypothetical protein